MIRFGRVVAVHRSRGTLDLVDQETGWPIAECKVIGDGSSDSGSSKIPDVARPDTEESAPGVPATGRVLIAAYSLLEGSNRAVVHGFVAPDNAQTGLNEANRSVERHPSGAYTTIAPDGSIEAYHPSGTYVRIGTGAHQDLAPLSADKTWTTVATAAAPTITMATAGFNLTVAPGGAATLTFTSLEMTGPVALNGTMTVTEDVIAGPDSISLIHHKHKDTQAGGGKSGVPVAS